MAPYYIVYCLMIAVLLKSNIRISIAASIPNDALEIPDNVCNTLACKESAIQILHNMDNSVKPCDDFYKFTCGGFIEKTSIPDSDTEIDYFTVINDEITEQLRIILEELSSPNEPRDIGLIRNYYKACMNKAAIEKRGLAPLKTELKKLGGWPVLEGHEWNETDFHWFDSIGRFNRAGFSNNYFLSFGIENDLKNSTKKVLRISEPSLDLSRDRLIEGMNNTKVQAYYKFMVDIAVMLGAPRDNATAELKESLAFQMELAKLTLPNTETRNQTLFYNLMTVSELSKKYPTISWQESIQNILAPHVTINNNETVIVTVPKFVSHLLELLNNTPRRVQANYAIWRAVGFAARYLNEDMTKRISEYIMESTNSAKSQPRWKMCVEQNAMFTASHAMYIRKHFNEASKNSSIEIVVDIMSQLKKTLQTIDWMDDKTRNKAMEKAAAISSYVGYPDELLNDTVLEELYKEVNFNDDNFLENRLLLQRYVLYETYRQFRESNVDENHWSNHATTAVANAFYNLLANSIEFPSGILQGVFFNADRPKYMNYGAIGSTIGHEITHAFDDMGRQFDKNGDLVNWWSETTNEKYRQKAQCIIDQYSNYTVEEIGKKLNGFNTQGENIADIGGFKIAYSAYKNWSKKHGKEQTLPGLNFNSQQMFWISAANVWCSKIRTKALENQILNDEHSPTEFRIFGSFRNLPEFAADFNCPVGSKMNPEEKCSFW